MTSTAHGAGDGPGRVRGSQQDDRNTDEDDLRGEARDPRYRSFDLASPHAWEARRGFLAELQQGTSFLRLADAALWAAAEDDALATNSPVRLPVDAFKQRLARLADNCGAALAAEGARRRETGGEEGELSDEEAVAVVMECVLGAGGLRVPDTGKSSVPGESVVAHPGVWERSSHAYLNQVLCNRVGTPASLAIVLIDVFQRLLVSGALSCGVIVDCEDFTEPPTARPAPGFTREALVAADGRVANTCTTDALCEVLRTLKRAFWPFAWESNVAADPTGAQGGFEAAARTALEGDDDATTEAISRFAKYRLKRGIYTSTGAGDLRRCVPACERLVLLCGDR
ncbi:unnamed protein product [Pedinophyceae sp. YPF-701]|nr:unnamed protein product [Pedinophyceae sp. YPF-701]